MTEAAIRTPSEVNSRTGIGWRRSMPANTSRRTKPQNQQQGRQEKRIPYNVIQMRPMYDFKTKNKSFIQVYEQLKLLGIKNAAFHLMLLNPLLQGVDPFDENLTNDQVLMIIQECKLNMFYYLREVVRIEEQGGQLVPFRMDRGTLAAAFCFYNNINFYLMKPRQTGKTVGITAMLSWAFKFSGPNGDVLFASYRPDISKKNLRAMKVIISHLPSYISKMGSETVDANGKTVRKTDNVTVYREPVQNNSAMIAGAASTEDSADTVGRGYTHIYQFFDEAEFTKYIGTIVKVSGMAYNTASRNAENNGSGHCRIFATTPGDLGNKKSCQSALEIVNDAVVWDEKTFYDDLSVPELKQMIKEQSDFRVVYIEYDYKQLGLGEDWFIDACSNVGGDVNKIKREILLMRYSGNSDSPFTEDEIEEINNNVKKPIAIKRYNKIYDVLFYQKPKRGRIYIMGLDPSDGTGNDNYAFTVIDPYDLTVVAEFKSPYMTVRGCVDLVTAICDKYFPNVILAIERNRNGGAVVEAFKESPLRYRVYSSLKATSDDSLVKDQLDENGFIKEEFIRNKYFGTNTTTKSRSVMMNILLDFMHFARNLVNSKYLVDDIKNLVVKNDKIQAAQGEHDDSVMSWLIAMYIYYYGEKLERYGFVKGSIPNDLEEDDKFKELKKLYKNPEIRKQFPTMYSYYMSELAKYEAGRKARQEKAAANCDPIGVGSIDMDRVADIPDIDEYIANLDKKNGSDGNGKRTKTSQRNEEHATVSVDIDDPSGSYADTSAELRRRKLVRQFASLNK